MHKPINIDLQSNKQCQCFPQNTPQHKHFLSKKPSFETNFKSQSFGVIPKNIQDALRQASVKKSLKRCARPKLDVSNGESPQREKIETQTKNGRDIKLRDARSYDGKNIRELLINQPSMQRINSTVNLQFRRVEPKPV